MLIALPIHAESGLRLAYPTEFGVIPAQTFDAGRNRVGDANVTIEKLESGNVRMTVDTAVDGGGRTVAHALLAPINGEIFVQPIFQESRSFDRDGNPLGVLTLDHRAGKASCGYPEKGDGKMRFEELPLPEGDRVVNVPLNLLFEPLVKGETKTVDFQLLLCRGGARLLDFKAKVARHSDSTKSHEPFVEVSYTPDQGKVLSFLTQAFIPKLSFWFNPESSKNWLAHRIPLYANGPEVYVVRQGITTTHIFD